MLAYLDLLQEMCLRLIDKVVFHFSAVLIIAGLLWLPCLLRRREWRLITTMLLFFFLWRYSYFCCYGFISSRYSLPLLVPLSLFAVPGLFWVTNFLGKILRYLPALHYRRWVPWTLIVVVLAGNIVKDCRFPKPKVYLRQMAEFLRPYTGRAYCLDGTREYNRLEYVYSLDIPYSPVKSQYSAEAWKCQIDTDLLHAPELFLLHDIPEQKFRELIEKRFGNFPFALCYTNRYRKQENSIWLLTKALSWDGATPVRSWRQPDPAGIRIPKSISLPRGQTLFLNWKQLTGAENWSNYVFSIDGCLYGFQFHDGYRYTYRPNDPPRFTVSITVRDGNGWLVTQQECQIINVAADAPMPEIFDAPRLKPVQSAVVEIPHNRLHVPAVMPMFPGRNEWYFSSMLTMPDPDRFRWKITGVPCMELSGRQGVSFIAEECSDTLRWEVGDLLSDWKASGEIVPVMLPIPDVGGYRGEILVISDGQSGNEPAWRTEGITRLQYRDGLSGWIGLARQLEAGKDAHWLKLADVVILDLSTRTDLWNYQPFTEPEREERVGQAIDTVLNRFREYSAALPIVIGFPSPPPPSQDAFAELAAAYQNRLFSAWKYRQNAALMSRILLEKIRDRQDPNIIPVIHLNIGAPQDFPHRFAPLANREIIGNEARLSVGGQKKMRKNLLGHLSGLSGTTLK